MPLADGGKLEMSSNSNPVLTIGVGSSHRHDQRTVPTRDTSLHRGISEKVRDIMSKNFIQTNHVITEVLKWFFYADFFGFLLIIALFFL